MTKKPYKNPDQPYYTRKVREFKKEHKEKGLCVYCNRKAMNGRTMCKEHIEYHKFYKKFKKKKN
jgi:hypothetical protein